MFLNLVILRNSPQDPGSQGPSFLHICQALFLIISSQVLEFVDDHGNEVLNLGSFTLLPQHVVRLILVREELKADEFSKFQVFLIIIFLGR